MEEVKERQAELSKMRALMFYQERKQHHMNKIKSKVGCDAVWCGAHGRRYPRDGTWWCVVSLPPSLPLSLSTFLRLPFSFDSSSDTLGLPFPFSSDGFPLFEVNACCSCSCDVLHLRESPPSECTTSSAEEKPAAAPLVCHGAADANRRYNSGAEAV